MQTDADQAGSSPADQGASIADTPAAADQSAAPAAAADATPKAEPRDLRDRLLDVVKSAVQDPPSPASATEDGTQATAPTDAATAAGGQAQGEPEIPGPFSKHPAWQRIAAKRREAERERDTLKSQIEELRAPAESYRKVEAFLRQSDVAVEQAAEAIQVAALLKRDLRAGREALVAYVQQIDQELGLQLPPDLQQRVQSGALDPDTARELSVTRQEARRTAAQRDHAADQARRTAATYEQQRVDGARQAHVAACSSAVDRWAQQQATRDPDFAHLTPLVKDRIVVLAREHGFPPSVEGAVQMAEVAVKQIKAETAKFRPAANATPPRPSAGGSASNARPSARRWQDQVYLAVGQSPPPPPGR